MENHVLVRYTTEESGGDICAGQENDDWPSHDLIERSHTLLGVFTEPEKFPNILACVESVEVSFTPVGGNTVYLVLCTYESGGTFGRSSGNVSIVSVLDDKDTAEAEAWTIRKGTYTGYKAWEGYFERLEDVEVHTVKLDETQSPMRF